MIDKINARLAALLNPIEDARLRDAMRYATLGAGKRLRPQLLLAACEAAKGSYDDTALDFACCLEMIHAYSLVHDDLPAMDDDDMRRGHPTVHIQFDEATAILAGDALLNLAYETMAHLCADLYRFRRPTAAMAIIAKAAGSNGMIGGQMLDLQSEGTPISIETLRAIHHGKTGALFTAALEAGVTLGGGTRVFLQGMSQLGSLVGLLFQMRDDILDITSTAKQLGKQPGSDAKNQKATYVSLLGMEKAQELHDQLVRDVLTLTQILPCKTPALRNLIDQIIHREK
ncbi:MAG: polyprenyl synthetase family protein [Defluviitaleaceae bacterium]|nr:polyprenyl synthetase family protein [Defluviitaleaceae bacterium]